MSEAQLGGQAVGETIEGFEDLYPRQETFQTWTVLSLRGEDAPKAYRVDTSSLSCDCPDATMNKQAPQICDHLATALFHAPRQRAVEEDLLRYLSTYLSDLREAAEMATDAASQFEGGLIQQRTEEAETASQAPQNGSPDDPKKALVEWLNRHDVNAGQVEIWIDDQFGSLQFRADNMDDDSFNNFRDACKAAEFVNWDRDNSRNFIKKGDFGELVA